MVVVAAPDRADALAAGLSEAGETVIRLGRVGPGAGVRYTGTLL
jgi:phosphoribosylformylglycinamidine cyclo-ligase